MNADLKNCARAASVLTISAAILLVIASAASAAIIPSQIVPEACTSGGSGCTICHMGELAINLTNFLMYGVALPATVVLVATGGIILLISGASEEKRTLGKKILTSAIIGVIIIFIAWLGVDTLIKILTGGAQQLSNFGPWNKFEIPTGGCPL